MNKNLLVKLGAYNTSKYSTNLTFLGHVLDMHSFMIRRFHPKGRFFAAGLALSLFVAVQIPSSALSESEGRSAGTNVTILTAQLPETLTTNTQLSGLTVVEIEPLNALGANLLHVHLDADRAPQNAITILNSAYPRTKFELLEDFERGDITIPTDVQ